MEKYRINTSNGGYYETFEKPQNGFFETIIITEPTPQEIQEQQIKQALSSETEKYKQRQADGVQMYAEISAEFRLAKLNGLMSESTQSAIERILIPVRNEVLAGQWISAKNELELIGNSTIGVDLYDRLHNQISNYITENY
ncbi:hypothetical protein [uncultured Flavobacterium sp.]|uniref:hypothetical protein n=1 Tax=uncultured Flavobacterium sp. TaxID=165435 RepID=UPI0030ED7A04|tara:strand:+ start:48768 stop:49190 length:423 start_codon:yes stop_codon:yes gene_type:complete